MPKLRGNYADGSACSVLLSIELQMCGRLIRQGQKHHVYVHHIMVKSSIDQVVMSAIKGKAKTQRDFVQLLRDYSKEKM